MLNRFDIKTYRQAISNSNGIVRIEDYSAETDFINVESINLDTFIKKMNLKSIDLLKIDVETLEPRVIEGFKVHLNKFKPSIIIEVLNGTVAEELNIFFKNLDYLFFNINENGTQRKTAKLEKSDSFNYLVCQEPIARKIKLI